MPPPDGRERKETDNMGKHDKPDPAGFPVGQPPGERDGSREKPGKHAEDRPKPTK